LDTFYKKACWIFNKSAGRVQLWMEPLKHAQINESVDQGVEVSDGLAISQMGTLNPQGFSLAVDPFSG
jgi:hypothetical protein